MKADSLLPASKNTAIVIMEFPGMLIVVVFILFISVLNFLTWMAGEH